MWVILLKSVLQHVALAAQGADQLPRRALIELAPQSGNIDFDHVAEFFPVVIV